MQSPTKRISRNLEMLDASNLEQEELLPLPADTLARNLGLDLIVVLTKVSEIRERLQARPPLCLLIFRLGRVRQFGVKYSSVTV